MFRAVWIFIWFSFVPFVLGPQLAVADTAISGTAPAQWRLTWKTDPTTEATLSWSTAEPGATHRVHFATDQADKTESVDCHRSGQYTAEAGSAILYYHHARLAGLKPATKYNVTLESDGKKSPPLYFTTAPAADQPFSVLYGGDSRSDREVRRQVNDMIRRMVAESHAAERPPIMAFAHGGDYVADGRNIDQWSEWMTDHELTTAADGRLLPIIPARGNHEPGEMFNEVFDFPAGSDGNYYAQSLGPRVRFVTLNSEAPSGGEQQAWLDAELASSRLTHRWLVVQYHRPAYPAVKMPGPALLFWVPLFEKHNVDLVCEADGHCIKRTVPIRNYKFDPTGIIYIGEGGLGVGQRTPRADLWYLQPPHGKCGQGHHVQLLTFAKDRLTYRVIRLGGEVFDEHHMAPRTLAQQ